MTAEKDISLPDNLLSSLSEQKFGNDDLVNFRELLDKLIKEQGENIFKFSNEAIANTVYNMGNDQSKNLKYNLGLIMESLPPKDSRSVLDKFLHSVSLSLTQREFILKNVHNASLQISDLESQLNKYQKNSKQIKQQIKNVTAQTNDVTEQMRDVNETKSTIYADFVSILGIFTAIVFAIFGGTKILGSFFDHISTPTILNLGYSLIVGGIYFLGVFGLVLIMFSGIYKITHKNEKYSFSIVLIIFSVTFSLILIALGFGVVWSYYK